MRNYLRVGATALWGIGVVTASALVYVAYLSH
jgi:hypothetical protein